MRPLILTSVTTSRMYFLIRAVYIAQRFGAIMLYYAIAIKQATQHQLDGTEHNRHTLRV